MKTIQEQIAVMQHFAAGGEVEFDLGQEYWHVVENPTWNWRDMDYRIKEVSNPYEMKLLAYIDMQDGDIIWRKEGYSVTPLWKRIPSEDKIIEVL